MARSVQVCSIKRYLLFFYVASVKQKIDFRSIYDREFSLVNNIRKFQKSNVCYKQYQNLSLHHFCTNNTQENICLEQSSDIILLRKLDIALKDHQVDEAWEAYSNFKSLHGFPPHTLISRLITDLSYSSDPKWLRRVGDLVFSLKEKTDLLRPDLLTKLSLSLARGQMPVLASTILRLMLERTTLPAVDMLGLIVLHMVKTEIGTSLASNILVEICEHFLHLSGKKKPDLKLIKPDTLIFNLVLDACVRFGSSFKGQQIIELMPQVGVTADAHTINNIAQIHDMNCQRDELKKFKDHIDRVSVPLIRHYRQFYDSLLNLHFKFNDIDSAYGLVMDMYRNHGSPSIQEDRRDPHSPCLVPIGSYNLKAGLRLQILPHMLQKDSVLEVEGKQELVMYKDGKFMLTNKALAKLIIRCKRLGKISKLSNILNIIELKWSPLDGESLCCAVVGACIHLGWLEIAHDILEDFECAGTPVGPNSYASLLNAYYKRKLFREAEALLKQIRKVGLVINMSDETMGSTCVKSELAESLIREMREEEKSVSFMIYELNSSIYFFMKAKMVEDAMKTYRRMQEMKILPTLSTFFTLVYGYSSLEMHRQITILWGDIKRNMEDGKLVANRDLYELLLLNFIRGGYFERVIEVIGHMKERGMFVDKWMYKRVFLKFHKDLYRSLKASKAKDEVQSNRIEHVRAFRKWCGIQ